MIELIVISVAVVIALLVASQGGYAPTPDRPITPIPKEKEKSMRKYRTGEHVRIKTPDFSVSCNIISVSPCGKFCKVRLDDETEMIIETRFIV